jgi:hypothetical protein
MNIPLPAAIAESVVPDDATLLEIAREVVPKGLTLATNGRRTVIVRDIPPGYHRLGVSVKERP